MFWLHKTSKWQRLFDLPIASTQNLGRINAVDKTDVFKMPRWEKVTKSYREKTLFSSYALSKAYDTSQFILEI